jgi:transcriptional regulator with XRE-family HTH domain
MLTLMPGHRSRAAEDGLARAKRLAAQFGRELRVARTAAGLTQTQLGALTNLSQQAVSRAEAGSLGVPIVARCQLAAACGFELGLRLWPVASVRLRDSGQLELAGVVVAAAHPSWTPELERPVAPGDARAADILFLHPAEVAEVEIERSLVDLQAQLRAAQLKRQALAEHETRPVRLILAVPDTAATRERIRPHAELLARALPLRSRQIWRALRSGEVIGADGLLFVRMDRVVRSVGPSRGAPLMRRVAPRPTRPSAVATPAP